MLVLALYNSVMTPFEFSFEYVVQRMNHPPLSYIELGIDTIYFIDIIVGFTTSYIDQFTGDEYFSPSKIAKHYLGSDFIIDFLSTFWFEELFMLIGYEQP